MHRFSHKAMLTSKLAGWRWSKRRWAYLDVLHTMWCLKLVFNYDHWQPQNQSLRRFWATDAYECLRLNPKPVVDYGCSDDTASKSKVTLMNSKIVVPNALLQSLNQRPLKTSRSRPGRFEIRTLSVGSNPPHDNQWGRAFSHLALNCTLPQSFWTPLQMMRVPTPTPSFYRRYPRPENNWVMHYLAPVYVGHWCPATRFICRCSYPEDVNMEPVGLVDTRISTGYAQKSPRSLIAHMGIHNCIKSRLGNFPISLSLHHRGSLTNIFTYLQKAGE